MEEITEQAKEQGYVETLFNRRRYIPELKSKQLYGKTIWRKSSNEYTNSRNCSRHYENSNDKSI